MRPSTQSRRLYAFTRRPATAERAIAQRSARVLTGTPISTTCSTMPEQAAHTFCSGLCPVRADRDAHNTFQDAWWALCAYCPDWCLCACAPQVPIVAQKCTICTGHDGTMLRCVLVHHVIFDGPLFLDDPAQPLTLLNRKAWAAAPVEARMPPLIENSETAACHSCPIGAEH